MADQEQADIRLTLAKLRQEHEDYDAAINAMIQVGSEALRIQRMKKKKLAIKDKMSQLEDQIIPTSSPKRLDMAERPAVAIIMGSQSDWETMKNAADTLEALDIGYEARIISAHRTPERMMSFAKGARDEGFQVIIAGAGGAAHLPGMTAAMTPLPVFGVPVQSKALSGQDSLLSIVQMPAGIPVGTLAIGRAGAINAALLAASVLALNDDGIAERLDEWRAQQTAAVADYPIDEAL